MINKPTDHHEAFEQAIALYDWCSHWYGGMGCDKYVAMSKLSGEYRLDSKCSIDYDSEAVYGDADFDEENESIIMIYKELTEENWQEIFDNFCDYMDNEWDDEAC